MTRRATATDALRRAQAFARDVTTGACERPEPHPWGLALHDTRRPRAWVLNTLHVTRALEADVDAGALTGELCLLYTSPSPRDS